VGLAADLQLVSAFHDTELVEYLAGSPYVDEVVSHPWVLDAEGMLAIPDAPGLGVELNLDALSRYTGDQEFLG
jgi:L-alanine-DL-glutamate epimerase-like enolase superfamily enzyme